MSRARSDGRAHDEMRPVEMVLDYQTFAEGSALVSVGRTRVLCAVTVQDGIPPWVVGAPGQGWISAEYAMLPRSTRTRTSRDGSARETEISQLIGRALRASVNLHALGERTFIVDCDVIQADGGTRSAAITGGYVALVQAVRRLMREGRIQNSVWRPPVAGVSVALWRGEVVLDPCHEEDIEANVDCDVALNAEGRLVELHAPASDPYTQEQLEAMLAMARPATQQLIEMEMRLLGWERWG